jgi:hypothetical protein
LRQINERIKELDPSQQAYRPGLTAVLSFQALNL